MTKTKKQIANALKKFFFTGFLHSAASMSIKNMYKMFAGISGQFKREYDSEEYLKRELNPVTTVDMIETWESEVGIPDQCFFTEGLTIEERRNQVIVKLTAHVQTAKDFVDLAKKLGVDVTVTPRATGDYGFPLTLPYVLFDTSEYFIIDVDIHGWIPDTGFPLELPYQLGGESYSSVIQCLFDQLRPANCKIEYH